MSTDIFTRVNEIVLKIDEFKKKIPTSREDMAGAQHAEQPLGHISSPIKISGFQGMPISFPTMMGLNTSSSSGRGTPGVKLPKIQLPKF